MGDDVCIDDEFGTIDCATNNFAKGGKLGEGGFRGAYKCLLSESNVEIAVKRVSRGSK